ncbi:YbaY family lipoprotein [Hymenobacter qilianensis]|uniref:YbaY family lipoprotein n=1 Tax=Hymenobacter qilianensis TaxID=1385715 RepID=A0A7H0GRW7_9BACT|nr:YbaY family lipoprotein [Hymenobacter qilianensis]
MKLSNARLGIMALALSACSVSPQKRGPEGDVPGQTVSAAVTGTVSYRERIALPPTAIVKLQLLDVSFADVAATVLDSLTLRPRRASRCPTSFCCATIRPKSTRRVPTPCRPAFWQMANCYSLLPKPTPLSPTATPRREHCASASEC